MLLCFDGNAYNMGAQIDIHIEIFREPGNFNISQYGTDEFARKSKMGPCQ